MDVILRRATIAGREAEGALDIGIAGGRIAAVSPVLDAIGPAIDLDGRLVSPGLVETHIHLDKTCIIDRCRIAEGTLGEAVSETAKAKKSFTEEDCHARGARTLENCIRNGTMLMRTHVEIDPGIGFRGFDAILRLAQDYAFAIDMEICVFPQEGLTNFPGTEPLLAAALGKGARILGAAPYTDTDPRGQIDRIFVMAREHDVDIDMHLDLGDSPEDMHVEYVCAATEKHGWGGRVAVGHVTRLSTVPAPRFAAIARRLADTGVAVTVLPSTDLYLTGRGQDHSVMRGVTAAHRLVERGVNCSLSTNNILNPFTPYGDGSLIRMANLYANVAHVGTQAGLAECFAMVTSRSARLMRRPDHGILEGSAADLVVFDCRSTAAAVAELQSPVFGLKGGRLTFARPRSVLRMPGHVDSLAEMRQLLRGNVECHGKAGR
ncbi:MAG: amidohydrolase family protein [Proteobacteria bacterium]|nr:amidohydrolase family protein [Pseudomonadota bacterium]